ncbi:MAG: flagellar biosynthesis protein FlhB [Sphingobium sp.]|nr:flagellar biosynthesis protein FlhB [Sphingobium sp.]MCP5399395.1 flagellar biosynthesis protein FlhB [Sphingomonas sp.]
MADNDQKTLDPTPKKLEDARKKGDVPSAPEMRHAAMFGGMLIIVVVLGGYAARELASLAGSLWGHSGERPLEAAMAPKLARTAIGGLLFAIGPLLLVTVAMAIAGLFLQGRPTVSASRLKLKWDRLSPMAGLKRLFGKQAWVEFAKTLAKFAFVAMVLGFIAWPGLTGLDHMIGADAGNIGLYATVMVQKMVMAVVAMVGVLALVDFVYQRRAWTAKMRMSHQEVKDEHKESEGDPQIKARVRAIQMQRARSRMMAAVPDASVIITNPTHYAVALKYDHGAMSAPVVVAKGVDLIAAKIREIADVHAVPIVESPPLARALYASVDVDQPIRIEHYKAVAEIISYVLRVTRKN